MHPKRPKRLWAVCGLNVLTAAITVAYLVALRLKPNLPAELVPDADTIIDTSLIAAILIIASAMAFCRVRNSRWYAFIASLTFYGAFILQDAEVLAEYADSLTPEQIAKLMTRCMRNALWIAVIAWALFSARTARYFAGDDTRAPAPQEQIADRGAQ